MITVINKRNGLESPMTKAQYEKISADPYWAGVFRVKETPEPPEVKEIKERKAKKSEADKSEDGK